MFDVFNQHAVPLFSNRGFKPTADMYFDVAHDSTRLFLTRQASQSRILLSMFKFLRIVFCPHFFKKILVFDHEQNLFLDGKDHRQSLMPSAQAPVFLELYYNNQAEYSTSGQLMLVNVFWSRWHFFLVQSQIANQQTVAHDLIIPRIIYLLYPQYNCITATTHSIISKWASMTNTWLSVKEKEWVINQMNKDKEDRGHIYSHTFLDDPHMQNLESLLKDFFSYQAMLHLHQIKRLSSHLNNSLNKLFSTNFFLRLISVDMCNTSSELKFPYYRVLQLRYPSMRLIRPFINPHFVVLTANKEKNERESGCKWNKDIVFLPAPMSYIMFVIWSCEQALMPNFVSEAELAERPLMLILGLKIPEYDTKKSGSWEGNIENTLIAIEKYSKQLDTANKSMAKKTAEIMDDDEVITIYKAMIIHECAEVISKYDADCDENNYNNETETTFKEF